MATTRQRTFEKTLADVNSGEDILNFLYSVSGGLGYEHLTDFSGSGVVAGEWDTFALRDGSGDTILSYIELDQGEEGETLSDLKQQFKRRGRPRKELFAVVGRRVGEGKFLQSEIDSELTFIRVEERLASDEVDLDFDLRIFELDKSDVAPVYVDFLNELKTQSGDPLGSLQDRVEETFSMKAVTKRFYEEFGEIFHDTLKPAIDGLPEDVMGRDSYAQLVVNRILFLLFVQEKGWLDRNTSYIEDMYEDASKDDEKDVYLDFFKPLFFNALNDPNKHEFPYLGTIPYFNGGLFEKKQFEDEVYIAEEFFDALLDPSEDPETYEPTGYLRRYKISLSESNPSELQLVVDPEFIGRIFEMFMQEQERSDKGAFYTPKSITQYMTKNALKYYLFEDFDDHEQVVIDLVANHRVDENTDEDLLRGIRTKLQEVQIVDPAVGSGAFIIAMIEELVGITESLNQAIGESTDRYQLKERFIADSLYGVDIDSGGIELCKFRVWLHLMQDLPADIDEFMTNGHKYALPNLGLKFFVGNSLVGDFEPTELHSTFAQDGYQGDLRSDYSEQSLPERIASLREEYLHAHGQEKTRIEEEIERLSLELDEKISWDKSEHWMKDVVDKVPSSDVFKWSITIPEAMLNDDQAGFDIVIGNPPYKGGSNPDYINELSDFYDERRSEYVKPVRKMVYDLYQKFIFRGEELVREGGVFTYITSSTLRTIATKTATRNLLQKNRLEELFITNPETFDAAVHASIFTLRHTDASDRNYELLYVNGEESPIQIYRDLIQSQPQTAEDVGDDETIERVETVHDVPSYRIPIRVYRRSIRKTFFEPSEVNQEIYHDLIRPISDLLDEWSEELYDVNRQRENLDEIRQRHVQNLSQGDVTLLGLLTWGGRGLDTANNDEHIAYIDGTYEAEQVKERNPDSFEYISKNENSYSWVSRVIRPEDVIDPNELTNEEKRNGIDPDKRDGRVWVPIEKGSSIEEIYYKPSIEYIDWSQDSLKQIENRRGGRLRDTSYYFREALFASRGGTGEYKVKVRYIDNAVVDGSGVVLIPTTELATAKYLNGVLNTDLMKYIIDNFINSTVNVQVSDMRLLPILIPTEEKAEQVISLVDEAIAIQKGNKDGSVEAVQADLEEVIQEMYGYEVEYQAT